MDKADETGTDGNGDAEMKKVKPELSPSIVPKGSTVDEHKQQYGMHSLSFWEPRIILHTYEVPVRLYPLIEATMTKLNKIYIPYAWSYVRTRKHDIWLELLEIEESINVAVECDNEDYLKEALKLYYEKWLRVLREFELIKKKYNPF